LTALFVFNGAIDGLDRRLQLNEPRSSVYWAPRKILLAKSLRI